MSCERPAIAPARCRRRDRCGRPIRPPRPASSRRAPGPARRGGRCGRAETAGACTPACSRSIRRRCSSRASSCPSALMQMVARAIASASVPTRVPSCQPQTARVRVRAQPPSSIGGIRAGRPRSRNSRRCRALKPPDVTLADPASDPDVQLMLRVRAGDAEAFRELFEKHSRAIVNFAYHFVGNRQRAEEIAQDVFLQIYRAAAPLRADGEVHHLALPHRHQRLPERGAAARASPPAPLARAPARRRAQARRDRLSRSDGDPGRQRLGGSAARS